MRESVTVAKEADRKQEFSPTNTIIHRVRDEHEMQLGSLGGVIGNIRRDGGKPSVESIATHLSSKSSTAERSPALLALQQTHGNRYVQRVVSGIQAKLVVGQPGDVYEQEADRVADEVMRMPESLMQRQEEEETIQLKPLAEQITPLVQRRIEEEGEELRAKELSSHALEGTPNLEARINAIRGGGQPLPESTRAFFEPHFGYDFNQVRLQTDAPAAEMAKALNAKAFTFGQNIVFGTGQYAPTTSEGKRLLAHELTHVIQQKGGEPYPVIRCANLYSVGFQGYPNDSAEIAAIRQGVWQPTTPDFGATAGGIGIDTIGRFLGWIDSQASRSIHTLNLIGHSNPAQFAFSGSVVRSTGMVMLSVGNALTAGNLARYRSEINNRNMQDKFASDARITLYSCHTGTAPGFLQEIANTFNVCVRGFSGNLNWCLRYTPTMTLEGRGEVTTGNNCPGQRGLSHLSPDVQQCPPP